VRVINKKSRLWLGGFYVYGSVFYFFTLTVAILTENNPLIIRTTIRMVIRERYKIVLIAS
jgi:hypothetical protein